MANKKTTQENAIEEIANYTDYTNPRIVQIFFGIIICSIIFIALTGDSLYKMAVLFADGLGLTVCFLFAGGLVGFIFGIPKALQNIPSATKGVRFVTNTSLEQISDWLTKTIIGLGLIEIRKIIFKIKELYQFLSHNLIIGYDCRDWALYLTCLSVISLFFGFLVFYVYTRINLSAMFLRQIIEEDKLHGNSNGSS